MSLNASTKLVETVNAVVEKSRIAASKRAAICETNIDNPRGLLAAAESVALRRVNAGATEPLADAINQSGGPRAERVRNRPGDEYPFAAHRQAVAQSAVVLGHPSK
ncbi:MAG: hypothetical protein V3T62_05155 [Alphaproteobacteria bacterium]